MKYFDMLKRYKGLRFKKKSNENTKTENKPKESINANNQKDENQNKDSVLQEVDPREDINNIENKFNPKKKCIKNQYSIVIVQTETEYGIQNYIIKEWL